MMAVCYREADPDMLRAYEKEVRLRDGRHMATELGHMFGTLRGDDAVSSEDEEGLAAATSTVTIPLAAGVGKKFPKSPRGKWSPAKVTTSMKPTPKRQIAVPTAAGRAAKRIRATALGVSRASPSGKGNISGPCLNIKTVFHRYGDSHVKDKTVSETVLSLTWESLHW